MFHPICRITFDAALATTELQQYSDRVCYFALFIEAAEKSIEMRLTFQNSWKYATLGLVAVLAVGFSFPQASAHITNSLSHNVGHILDAIAALQSDVNGIETDVNTIEGDVNTIEQSVGTLEQKAITVRIIAPEDPEPYEILPLDNENNRVYHGHLNGILTVVGDDTTSVGIYCALNIANAPLLTIAKLDGVDGQTVSIGVDEEFSCTSMRIEVVGSSSPSPINADLVVTYNEIDGLTEIEDAPA